MVKPRKNVSTIILFIFCYFFLRLQLTIGAFAPVADILDEFKYHNNFDFNRNFRRNRMPPLATNALLQEGRFTFRLWTLGFYVNHDQIVTIFTLPSLNLFQNYINLR